MDDIVDRGRDAREVFSGLVPTPGAEPELDETVAFRSTRLGKSMMATVPVVLAGAMTVSMNLTGPLESASASMKRPALPKQGMSSALRGFVAKAAPAAQVDTAQLTTAAIAATASGTYTVRAGDTVSTIAGRHGLSTASVLALNGLSWKSLIFPGQVLKLSGPSGSASSAAAPAPATAIAAATVGGRYTIVKGDTVSGIAARFGVSTQAVLSANGLTSASIIYPGRTIAIPSSGGLNVQTVAAVTPIAAPAAPAPSAPAPSSGGTTSYVIRSGDTVSSIAARFGIPVAAVLAANGLSGSSVIYAGRTLSIPTAASSSAAITSANPASGLTPEMTTNVRTIIQVGQRLGVPDRGIVIALAAAAQESGLRNLGSGDRDSVGVFQQRPSTGWGAPSQLMTVSYAAQLFYGGPQNPNAGRTRGLLDIPGWQSMTVTQAAQAVQISAYPDAYAKWESSATTWLAQYR